ncbi:MAG: AsmA family protein, partial [Chitinophagales bacterium]
MKKVIVVLVILIGLVVLAAIAIPILYKDKIVEKIKSTVNEKINAKVNFGSFDLTILGNFPNLTLCLNDISVIGSGEFEGDTLTSIKELEVSLDLMSAIKGEQIKIRSVNLHQALINLLVLKDGKANWDITKPAPATTATTSSSYNIALNDYRLDQSEIRYNDESAGISLVLKDVNHSGKGDFTQDLFVLSTNTEIAKAFAWYGGVNYLN